MGNATPRQLYPRGKRPCTYCIRSWVGSRTNLDGCGKSRPNGVRSPDRLTRSESLYRLSDIFGIFLYYIKWAHNWEVVYSVRLFFFRFTYSVIGFTCYCKTFMEGPWPPQRWGSTGVEGRHRYSSTHSQPRQKEGGVVVSTTPRQVLNTVLFECCTHCVLRAIDLQCVIIAPTNCHTCAAGIRNDRCKQQHI